MKYGIMFVSLLVAGLGFAGGIDQGKPQIAVPCAAWMAAAFGLLIWFSKRDERREKNEEVLRVRGSHYR